MEYEDRIPKDSEIRINMNWFHYLTIALCAVGCLVGGYFVYDKDLIYSTQLFVLAAVLTYASFVDFKLHLAPDWITFVIFATSVPSVVRLITSKNYGGLFDMLIGGLVCFIPLFVGCIFTKGGIGGADIKIMGAVGLFVGTYKSLFTLIVGLVLAVIVSCVLIAMGKMDKKEKLPLIPYFTASTILISMVPALANLIIPVIKI